MICAVLRSCYLEVVPRDGPAPPGSSLETQLKVSVMFLAKFDRFAPVFLMLLGFVAAGGTASLGV